PDQELVAGRRHRLRRPLLRQQHHLQPDRPDRAGDRAGDERLSADEPHHRGPHEPRQRALSSERKVETPRWGVSLAGCLYKTTVSAAVETLKPPATSIGLLGWLRKYLFSTWYNALLSVLALWLLYLLASALYSAVTTANWNVVSVNLRLFMIGRY